LRIRWRRAQCGLQQRCSSPVLAAGIIIYRAVNDGIRTASIDTLPALASNSRRPIVQPNTEISHRSSNLLSATEVAETIGTDLETINEWLEVGAIDRAVFGGGRFSKYELQRAALTFEMVKLGLAPSRARDVVWEMEYDLQQIWGATVSNHYKAYAILIPNKQNKWLVFWCWTASKEEIEPPAPGHIILPVSDILARVTNETEQPRQH
jgi:hypothetical protein